MKKIFVVFFVLLFVSLTPINLVFARDGSDDNSDSSGGITQASLEIRNEIEKDRLELKEKLEKRKTDLKNRLASKAAERKEKLEENKLKICEKRKDNLKNRANKVVSRIERHFNRFNFIVTKADEFYTTKLVPKGVVIDNYTSLKADIATQKAEVESLLTTLKADIVAFDCSADSPKSQLETVKAEIKDIHEAMKDYRTAIKNFIKAIKNAVGEKKEASPSAEID